MKHLESYEGCGIHNPFPQNYDYDYDWIVNPIELKALRLHLITYFDGKIGLLVLWGPL